MKIIARRRDRKSTRLNSSHVAISYAVFCLKKKKHKSELQSRGPTVHRVILHKDTETTDTSFVSLHKSRSVDLFHLFPHVFCFFFFLIIRRPPKSTLFPHTPPFR